MSSHSALHRRPSTPSATCTVAGPAVRVVGEVAAPVAPVHDGPAARPGAGQLDPHRQRHRRQGVGLDDGADRAGVADGRVRRAEALALVQHQQAGQLGGTAASHQLLGLLAGHPHVVEDVEPVHRHRDAELGRGLQHDGRRLGVVPDVELGRGGGVADGGRATHEDDLPQPGRGLRPGPQQQRDVGHRRQRHEGDPVGLLAGRRLQEHVAQQLDGVPGVGLAGGAGPAEVAHAVLAVHVRRVPRRLQQRPCGASRHGHVGPAGEVEHRERVGHDVVHAGVPAHTGHRAQVEGRVPGGEQERAGVVHAGVDIQDDGQGPSGHDLDPSVAAA